MKRFLFKAFLGLCLYVVFYAAASLIAELFLFDSAEDVIVGFLVAGGVFALVDKVLPD